MRSFNADTVNLYDSDSGDSGETVIIYCPPPDAVQSKK